MNFRYLKSGFFSSCIYSAFFTCVMCILCIITSSAVAETSISSEYRVKSAFLINFSRFVNWPVLPESEFNVCVHGDNPFGKALDSLDGRSIKDRTLMVMKTNSPQALDNCQVVFFGTMSPEEENKALEYLQFRPTLTVGESKQFINNGGMIRFLITNGRIGFEINQDPAIQVNLKISSKLLRLSTVSSASEDR